MTALNSTQMIVPLALKSLVKGSLTTPFSIYSPSLNDQATNPFCTRKYLLFSGESTMGKVSTGTLFFLFSFQKSLNKIMTFEIISSIREDGSSKTNDLKNGL